MPKQVFCGHCVNYQGTEKVPNPKNTSWRDASRPKCAIGKVSQDYHCAYYEPNETTRINNEKFEQEMKQLQLLGNINARILHTK